MSKLFFELESTDGVVKSVKLNKEHHQAYIRYEDRIENHRYQYKHNWFGFGEKCWRDDCSIFNSKVNIEEVLNEKYFVANDSIYTKSYITLESFYDDVDKNFIYTFLYDDQFECRSNYSDLMDCIRHKETIFIDDEDEDAWYM